MLALKQALSLVSTKSLGGSWSPTDESSLQAWYKNKTGITLNGTDVSAWNDSSSRGIDMVQPDDPEQPAYNSGTGALTFDADDKTNLQTTTQISIGGDFTLGIKMTPNTTNGTFLADNTTANELFKISSLDGITVKIDGSGILLELDSTEFGNDYIVLTRVSDLFTLYQNGVAQTGTNSLSGTIDIDAIGIRKTDVNGFTGDIKEIQIYSSSDATLTSRINARLSTL
tara:strand:+ start:664 stop:1344 length:681 start_codon:yes stop_codon:yes gene_type:complete